MKACWRESSGAEKLGESKGEKHGSVRSWRCQEASKPTALVGHTISGTRLGFSTEGGGLRGAGVHLLHVPLPFLQERQTLCWFTNLSFLLCVRREGSPASRLPMERTDGSPSSGLLLHAAQATELSMSLHSVSQPLCSHSISSLLTKKNFLSY